MSCKPKCILANNGKSIWSVVMGCSPSPSENYAAEEFISHFRQITGCTLPIRVDKSPITQYEICIGTGKHTAGEGVDDQVQSFGKEGFLYRIDEKRIIIAGNKQRGTLYGVYEFLETELGIRWYSPDCTIVPKRATVKLELKNYSFEPYLEYRETLCVNNNINEKFDAAWFVRNRLNRYFADPDEKYGGGIQWAGFVHTYQSFVPPSEYYDTHPEYFSFRKDEGKRVTGKRAQLCLSNPEVLQIVIEKTKQWLRDNPAANIVSVSHMDGVKPEDVKYCQCPECTAVDEYEESQSGSILRFANKVADAIAEEFPYASVDIIAYSYATKPPKHEKAHPNVIVRPCFHGKLVDEWSKVADRMYIWDYVTNFRHYVMPFPNYDLISSHINGLIDQHIRGIFIQSTYNTKGTDFNELKAYLYAKVMWHPETDVNALIDEFMSAYFETSAPPLCEYLNILRAKIKESNTPPPCFVNPPVDYMTPKVLKAADKLFDRAESLAPDDRILDRVRRMRLSVRFIELMYTPKDNPDRPAMIDQYFEDIAELGVELISERNELKEAKQRMLDMSGLYELSKALPGEGYNPDAI